MRIGTGDRRGPRGTPKWDATAALHGGSNVDILMGSWYPAISTRYPRILPKGTPSVSRLREDLESGRDGVPFRTCFSDAEGLEHKYLELCYASVLFTEKWILLSWIHLMITPCKNSAPD